MKTVLARGFLCVAVSIIGSLATAQSPATKVVAIKAARALDVRTGAMVNNAVIIIEGERIKEIGANVAIPANAEVIDLGSKTVLPGLIDSHTHLTFDLQSVGAMGLSISTPRAALIGARNA
ncbi:MAG: amidohydrolase family protein, partial [Blastocatellia bacterium]